MKKFSKHFFTGFVTVSLLAISSKGLAQEIDSYGFLNIVNLVPGSKNCKIGLAGKDTVPGGLGPANSTGWFIVPSGNLTLSLEIEGYDKGLGNIDIADNKSVVSVIFLEANPVLDKDGNPLPPKIKAKRCEILSDKTGFGRGFFSVKMLKSIGAG